MHTKNLLSASVVVSVAFAASPGFAQQADSTAPATPAAPAARIIAGKPEQTDASRSNGIEEIVVTAQKRSENVQKVPISITAISGASLQARGITSSENLNFVTPGLNIVRQQQSAVIFLRGLGSNSASIGDENSVATYVDGVYLFSADAFFTDFNDVQRIEVLKGPQGTLYGRNATGGLINIITRDPSADSTVEVEVGYGNSNTSEGKLYANTGIAHNVAANVAVVYKNQADGYGYNRVRNTDYLQFDELGIKSKVVIGGNGGPTKVTLAADWGRNHSDLGVSRRPEEGSVLALGSVGFQGFYVSPNDFKSDSLVKTYGGSARLEQDLGGAQLLSITALRGGRTEMDIDQDGSPVPYLHIRSHHRIRQFTQELQLLSPLSSRLKWIVGAFYMDASGAYVPQEQFGLALTALGGGKYIYTDSAVKSLSGFAQATYDILPRTNLTLGARYTRDQRHISGYSISYPGLLVPGSQADQHENFQSPTWRIALDHQLTDTVLIYTSYNRGFKAGNFNSTNSAAPPVNPEKVDAYEAGFKTDLFDHMLRFNGSAFYYIAQNLQLQANRATVNILSNAAKAHVKGLELESTFAPTNNLTFNAGLALLDAQYVDYVNAPATVPIVNANGVPIGGNRTIVLASAAGNDVIKSPPIQFNASANYVVPSASSGNFAAIETSRRIEAEHGPIDTVILCAGIFRQVSIQDWSTDAYRQLVEVNILGTVNAIAGVLPQFVERNAGTIAIVSSMAQYRGLPRSAGYGATKAALLSMGETLRMQTRGTNIKVQIIVPGPVLTRMSASTAPAHRPYQLQADEAARRILEGMAGDSFEILLPKKLVWRFKLTRWMPNRLYFWYASRTPVYGGSRS
jgi:iron complex outermembrane receptor protein